MNIHKRIIIKNESREVKLDYFGINSKGSFTIVLQGGEIINLSKEEFEKLKGFIGKIK